MSQIVRLKPSTKLSVVVGARLDVSERSSVGQDQAALLWQRNPIGFIAYFKDYFPK
ncbi:hypothetical protein ACFQ14_11895 [Pseudahrensia aquimaris]|uniref:Uncharacterized protein n=1 Tax=Pseudahrensia aquimaris TaxID=744461 RepID=A0ABW3FK44_9HYPH